MHITEEIARKILNLNPFPDLNIIDPIVAERQFQVVVKGFNYLLQEKNNFLYIGDEVGLGKTYIAMGIASLLRLYSENPGTYSDIILVPKQNLQYKWQKEIRNFIQNNYQINDNIVKSVLNLPVGRLDQESIKQKMEYFQKDKPRYLIYRNSSFSLASDHDEESWDWINKLEDQVPEQYKKLYRKIAAKFKREPIIVKRAVAHFMNSKISEIDLLIVDEAHNFRHGVSNDVSIRNQTVSRMMGATKDDPELFDAFPEMEHITKPKVKKLLLLSATPINNSLIEIKNQLDCFLYQHRFKLELEEKQLEKTINKSLNQFMIRGVMKVNVNGKDYSRNGYRFEHRKGNVLMDEIADFQTLKDNSIALVLSLMQYKTIKELKLKSFNQFEMGMLAGFESFNVHTTSKYEEDTLDNRRENEAKDEKILQSLVASYYKEFNDYPPHPKQESLVEELFKLLINNQKALVFVRRIASVRELERKLFKKYSDYLAEKIKRVTLVSRPSSVRALLDSYDNEHIREEIESVIDKLADRVTHLLRKEYAVIFGEENNVEKEIQSDLREINNSLIDNSELDKFKELIKSHANLKVIKSDLKEEAIRLIKARWRNELILETEENEDEENTMEESRFDEEKAPYFFQRFFYVEGKKFKNRIYNKDWYELNLVLVNDAFRLFRCDKKRLAQRNDAFNQKTDYRSFQMINEVILQAIKNKESSDSLIDPVYRTNTFLTELLLRLCRAEFSEWIRDHRKLINEYYYSRFLDTLDILTEILKSIFRQGSGLLPAFIADAKTSKNEDPRRDFIDEMTDLLEGEFNFVLKEVKQVIRDYDKLVERNFDDVNKIRYNLIQQLPVSGVSGHHKKDVRKTAIQFRMPGYPYILITTDILKEGEDLHSYCKNIYHYGIAWNPSDMEQRTGRVDRIDSLSFRKLRELEGSNVSGIPFKNKLQVFYPYLADTLEVNQMIRLFNGMDSFIEIFYNDLSAKIEKNSKAALDGVVIELPVQRSGLLESKYEYNSFLLEDNGSPLATRQQIGTGFQPLKTYMEGLLEHLNNFEYYVSPEFDTEKLIVTGVMKLPRQGPFKIYFRQKDHPGIFNIQLESVLGRVQILGKTSYKDQIFLLLKDYKQKTSLELSIKEINSYVFIVLVQEIEQGHQQIIQNLRQLIVITDEIEEKVIGKDETIEFT